MKKYHSWTFMFLFFITTVFSQTVSELEKQKSELETQINYTTSLLNTISSDKKKSITYLNILNTQIAQKEQYVVSLNREISQLNNKINVIKQEEVKTNNTIELYQKELKKAKDAYAKMIYAAYKYSQQSNEILFIVSSQNFYQAYKRILYLKQLVLFRKKQAQKIEEINNQLTAKKTELQNLKDNLSIQFSEKKNLLEKQKEELQGISQNKVEKNNVINNLIQSESNIKKKLQDQKKKIEDLNIKIKQIIEEEIAKANNSTTTYSATPEAQALSEEFSKNKGKLPWPVEKGVIVSRYGVQKHPVFKNVQTHNNGINIATNPNSRVRSVFEGVVSRIFLIKGEGKAILINHGEYFTVYSGLKEVSVKNGDKVFAKQDIGILRTNEEESKTEIHFEIWKGYEKNDPSKWLYNAY
tara:strand:- start:366166 stop:367401 length:1236 start_codon:yes stop_codon:yes gene_type:complete